MSSGVTVVSVKYHQIRLQTSKFFLLLQKKIHKTFEALAKFFHLITAALMKLMSFYSPLTRTILIF